MEAYIAYVRGWLLNVPATFLGGLFLSSVAVFIVAEVLVQGKVENKGVNLAIIAGFVWFVFLAVSNPTLRYFVPRPDDAYLYMVGLIVSGALLLKFVIFRRRSFSKPEKPIIWWQIAAGGEMAANGNWATIPKLIVNGETFTFDTPDGYLYLYQEIKRAGAGNEALDTQIKFQHDCLVFRKHKRVVLNLNPDPPFIPTVRLPVAEIPTWEAPPFESETPSNAQAPKATRKPKRVSKPKIIPDTPAPTPATIAPVVQAPAAPVVNDLPPGQPIVLKLKRSQKQGALGGNIYMLDARIDVSAEVRAIITKHKLGKRVIYESEARQKHTTKAQGHLANRNKTSILAPPSEQAMGAAKAVWKIGRAAVSATRASLALRVTVNSLLEGVHVECKSLEELLEAEEAFRGAKSNLDDYIETTQSFDGREEIV